MNIISRSAGTLLGAQRVALVLSTFLLASAAHSSSPDMAGRPSNEIPENLRGVGITEKLGSTVSLKDLRFKDEAGEVVSLSKYFHTQKPVLLAMVYFECPSLCSLVLGGMLDTLKGLDWTPGEQFELVAVSIDPREGPALAAAKKKNFVEAYGRPKSAAGWHFLTVAEAPAGATGKYLDPSVKRLADEIGFGYRYDEKGDQFAHGAALFVLTPEGKISRYLYGVQWAPKDVKLGLLEASNGKIGTIVDRFLLFCYRYDPVSRKYSLVLTKIMQASGAGTVGVFGGYLAVFWRRQRRRSKAAEGAGPELAEGR